jgi:hypothetical protein
MNEVVDFIISFTSWMNYFRNVGRREEIRRARKHVRRRWKLTCRAVDKQAAKCQEINFKIHLAIMKHKINVDGNLSEAGKRGGICDVYKHASQSLPTVQYHENRFPLSSSSCFICKSQINHSRNEKSDDRICKRARHIHSSRGLEVKLLLRPRHMCAIRRQNDGWISMSREMICI